MCTIPPPRYLHLTEVEHTGALFPVPSQSKHNWKETRLPNRIENRSQQLDQVQWENSFGCVYWYGRAPIAAGRVDWFVSQVCSTGSMQYSCIRYWKSFGLPVGGSGLKMPQEKNFGCTMDERFSTSSMKAPFLNQLASPKSWNFPYFYQSNLRPGRVFVFVSGIQRSCFSIPPKIIKDPRTNTCVFSLSIWDSKGRKTPRTAPRRCWFIVTFFRVQDHRVWVSNGLPYPMSTGLQTGHPDRMC